MVDNTTSESPQQGMVDDSSVNPNNQSYGDDPIIGNNDENLISDNQETLSAETPSEPQPSVEESQGMQQNQEPHNWEASAKYFQSEKDKLFEENKKLQEQISQVGQPEEPVKEEPKTLAPPEDFDPWDAYNDPNSSSYQFRVQQEQSNINNAVGQVREELVGQYKQQQQLSEFDKELGSLGLNEQDKKSFYEFANTPVAQMGTEQLVQMWKATSAPSQPTQGIDPSIQATQRTQAAPSGAGVLQGGQPVAPKVNETDAAWDAVMNAAKKSKMELK